MTRQDGFTLLELLLAVAMLAGVAVAAMAALEQLTDADARATQNIESTVGVYRALQTFRADVAYSANIEVTDSRCIVTQADGTAVDYTVLAGGSELHRNVYASRLLVPLLVVDALTPASYGARGHLKESDFRTAAILQGTRAVSFEPILGRRTGTATGAKVLILHTTSHGKQIANACAMCWPLVERDAKP
ncbi:MAG: type II secretion system protein [Planctomycetes bacterium]|nr:type II secretion system protein [Planctomycetota bacterium]